MIEKWFEMQVKLSLGYFIKKTPKKKKSHKKPQGILDKIKRKGDLRNFQRYFSANSVFTMTVIDTNYFSTSRIKYYLIQLMQNKAAAAAAVERLVFQMQMSDVQNFSFSYTYCFFSSCIF